MAAKQFDFRSLERPFEADWPVTVSEPVDGGTVAISTFMGRFRLLAPAEVKKIVETAVDGREVFRAYFVGFGRGVAETFTPELLEVMLDRPYVRDAIITAYNQFCAGTPAKNSEAPPAS